MVEYIERDKAIEAVRSDPMGGLNYKRILTDIPAADVVPVVRCDNCKYYGSRRWCELHSSVFDDNAFCSYGEKRGEEDEMNKC